MDASCRQRASVAGRVGALESAHLIATTDLQEKPAIVEVACAVIIRELRTEGLTDSPSDFLLEHAYSVHGRIQDSELRQRFAVIS